MVRCCEREWLPVDGENNAHRLNIEYEEGSLTISDSYR